jgi:hypothetical protein
VINQLDLGLYVDFINHVIKMLNKYSIIKVCGMIKKIMFLMCRKFYYEANATGTD